VHVAGCVPDFRRPARGVSGLGSALPIRTEAAAEVLRKILLASLVLATQLSVWKDGSWDTTCMRTEEGRRWESCPIQAHIHSSWIYRMCSGYCHEGGEGRDEGANSGVGRYDLLSRSVQDWYR
jgi:hypothetical protein